MRVILVNRMSGFLLVGQLFWLEECLVLLNGPKLGISVPVYWMINGVIHLMLVHHNFMTDRKLIWVQFFRVVKLRNVSVCVCM